MFHYCRNITYNKRPKRNVWAPDLLPNLTITKPSEASLIHSCFLFSFFLMPAIRQNALRLWLLNNSSKRKLNRTSRLTLLPFMNIRRRKACSQPSPISFRKQQRPTRKKTTPRQQRAPQPSLYDRLISLPPG